MREKGGGSAERTVLFTEITKVEGIPYVLHITKVILKTFLIHKSGLLCVLVTYPHIQTLHNIHIHIHT